MPTPELTDTPVAPAGPTPEQVAELEHLRARAQAADVAEGQLQTLQERITAGQKAGDPGAAEALRVLSGNLHKPSAPPVVPDAPAASAGTGEMDEYAMSIVNAARQAGAQDAIKAVMEHMGPQLDSLRSAIEHDRTATQKTALSTGDTVFAQRVRASKNDYDAWLAQNPEWGQATPEAAFKQFDYDRLLKASEVTAQANTTEMARRDDARRLSGLPVGQGTPGAETREKPTPREKESPAAYFKRVCDENREILNT